MILRLLNLESKPNWYFILITTNYKKAIEMGNIIEVYTEGDDLF